MSHILAFLFSFHTEEMKDSDDQKKCLPNINYRPNFFSQVVQSLMQLCSQLGEVILAAAALSQPLF